MAIIVQCVQRTKYISTRAPSKDSAGDVSDLRVLSVVGRPLRCILRGQPGLTNFQPIESISIGRQMSNVPAAYTVAKDRTLRPSVGCAAHEVEVLPCVQAFNSLVEARLIYGVLK